MHNPLPLANEASTSITSESRPAFVIDDSAIPTPTVTTSTETAVTTSSETAKGQIQRGNASFSLSKPHPCSARNLLLGLFKKRWERPPTAEKLKNEHAQVLLKTPIGRDFNLVTAAGVEYKVHSTMLIGGSKMLQDGLFPDDALHPDPPKQVNLPPNFHPILVDRIVNFIYTSDYAFDPSNLRSTSRLTHENFKFHNSTFMPPINPPTPAMIALAGIHDFMFHFHMYSLGEALQYASLKSAAHAKLYDTLLRQYRRDPSIYKDAVDAVFSAPGTSSRICADEDGILQQLVAAAVVGVENHLWDGQQYANFVSLCAGPEYAGFWTAYNAVKDENVDLLKQDVRREFGDMRRTAKSERRLARKTARMAGAGLTGDSMRKGGMLGATTTMGANRPRDKFKKRQVPREKPRRVAKEDGDMEMETEMEMEMD